MLPACSPPQVEAAKRERAKKDYGVLPDQLILLPYDPPKFYEYLIEMGMGTFQVSGRLMDKKAGQLLCSSRPVERAE
jgi:hypothetical protein